MKFDGWYALRQKRDKILTDSDKYMISDFPVETKLRGLYKEYRKYLRDLPKLFNDTTIKNAKVKSFDEWLAFRKDGNY